MARIGPAEVRARYGVDPKQVPDFIALARRSVRPHSGRARPRPDGAAALLRQYGSLDKLLKAGRFAAHARDLKLYRSLATMDRKAPLPRLPDQTPTWDKAAALAREWQLNALAKRLDELAKQQS